VRVRVDALLQEATYRLVAGERFETTHWGEALTLRAGEPVTRPIPPAAPLEPPRQPRGREPQRRAAAVS